MKCYNHENIDAIGICKNCGIAICRACSVFYDGKLLCLSCKDRIKNNNTAISEQSNIQQLINDFDYYLKESKKVIGISSRWSEGVINHIKVIDMVRKADNYKELIQDDHFLEAVHSTLIQWGLNRRGAKIKPFKDFKENILANTDAIYNLKKYELEKLSNLYQIKEQIITLFNSLNVMQSRAKLVSVSKTLAHFLPDLIPPIDYQNIYIFFYGDKGLPTYAEVKKFWKLLEKFHYIQKRVGLSKENHKLEDFNTSVPKIIDNAIWGFNYDKENKTSSNINNKVSEKLKRENKPGIPVWKMITDIIKDLGKEFTSKDIIDVVIKKYGNVNKNTLQRNIYLLTVNNPLRIYWSYNQKERLANSQYDLLFNNEKNNLEIYIPEKHGIWEIIKEDNKFKINLTKAPVSE